MQIIFFGNRGSRPIGASENSPFATYGGDTTSVGIVMDDGTLLGIDAGSGFWKWDYTLKKLMKRQPPYELHVLFSHYHDDHTMGLPQSPFLFVPENKIHLYGPDFGDGLKDVFLGKANRPYNPDLSKVYQADIAFNDIITKNDSRSFTLPNGAAISWIEVKHGFETSLGYRIDYNGQSFCMISDTDHALDDKTGKPVINDKIAAFIKDCDMLIYDCHFTDEEFHSNPSFHQALGHSTGEHGVRLCEAANIPLLISHHHNPNNDDDRMDIVTKGFKNYGAQRGVYVMAAKPSLVLDLALSPSARIRDTENQDKPQDRWDRIAALGK